MSATPKSVERPVQPTVNRIKSPLTRVAYRLAGAHAHLVFVIAGSASMRGGRNGESRVVEGPSLIWCRDGGDAELVVEGGARGVHVAVPELALMRAFPPTALGDQMRRTLSLDLLLPLPQNARMPALIAGFADEFDAREPGYELALAHSLALVLTQLWRLARIDPVTHGQVPQNLAERFVSLAKQRVHEHWRVADYARTLGVNRDRLGSAVQRITGLSPQHFLHRELVREASELLTNTAMPVGQVAFRLGFSDAAYFTRFFCRQTGLTPSAFRKRLKQRSNMGEDSFAAWP